jgi:N-acetylglucosamine kinase-like BadF-type ATPase
VDRAAGEGDIAALEILRKAGEKLARYGLAVRRNLFSVDRVVPVVRVGGVFESGFVRDSFVGCLSESGGCEPCAPMFDPEVGALIGAYRLAGLEVVPDGF